MNYFKKLYLILILLIVGSACTKKGGITTSKIKIFGGKAFSNTLATKANNGLVLYGKSTDGKSFTKIIDSDTFEMVFPNGTWNFYTIAWEYGTPSATTGLMGTVSCGKSLGVVLNGTDASINMTLDNANCDGAIHPDADTVAGIKKLPSFSLYSCRNLSTINAANNGSNCSQGNSNKGFATYVKLFIPEHRQFNQSGDGVAAGGIYSKCFAIDANTSSAGLDTSESSFASSLNIPMPGINGMVVGVRTYYSATACDDNTGFDNFYWKEGQVSTKLKRFTDHSGGAGTQAIENYFIQTDPSDVCKAPRLNSTAFASGIGSTYLPYGICTVDQFKLLKTNFTTGLVTNNKSFDLLNNLDFNFAEFQPIGDDTSANSSPATMFTGNFNGNKFKVEKFLIKCKNLFAASGIGVGLFRATSGNIISDLTLNKVAIACDDDSQSYGDVGGFVGTSTNTTFKNLKFFGYVGGGIDVGGIAGYFNGNSAGNFTDVHVEAHIEGKKYVGGILGYGNNFASIANKEVITKSSFKGEVRARVKGNYTGTTAVEPGAGTLGDYKQMTASLTLAAGANVVANDYIYWDPDASNWRKLGSSTGGEIPSDSYTGGIGGYLVSSNIGKVTEVKVELDKLEASRVFGGIAGGLSNVGVENSYVTGFMRNSGSLDGTVGGTGFSKNGGLVGITSNASMINNIVNVIKEIKTEVADTTDKGLVGSNGSSTCTDNKYLSIVDNDSCQSSGNLNATAMVTYANYPGSFNFGASTIWSWPTADQGYDIPKLVWEASKENEVPYIKRLCSNLWIEGNRTGTGDTVNSPRSVCNMQQLMSMTAGKYYELKRSILHDGTGLTGFIAAGKIPAGKYFLNGNNFTIGNFFISASGTNNGLFESLSTGSEIKNFRILKGIVGGSGQTIASGAYLNGIVASENYGIIRNVQIENSAINVASLSLSGTGMVYVGGVVGKNFSTGVIENIQNNVNIVFDQPTVNSGASLKVGGAAAYNAGTIKIIRQNGEVIRKIGDYGGGTTSVATGCNTSNNGYYVYQTSDTTVQRCDGSSFINVTAMQMSTNEIFAGFVADNAGNIEEVEQEGGIVIRDVSANTAGKISPFVATMSSSSSLKDIYYRGRIENFRAQIINFFDSFAGSINRMIFSFQNTNGVNFSTSGSIIPATGTSETICVKGSSFSDCHNGTMTYDFSSANGLTFNEGGSPISGFQYLTGWNIGSGFIPDLARTWNLENPTSSSEPPSLMRTGGDFSRIGEGF